MKIGGMGQREIGDSKMGNALVVGAIKRASLSVNLNKKYVRVDLVGNHGNGGSYLENRN